MNNDFYRQFIAIHNELKSQAAYWRPSAYQTPQPEWFLHNPTLAQAVLSLDESQLYQLEQSLPCLVDWLARFLPSLSAVSAEAEPAQVVSQPVPLPSHWHAGIPGRKREQIELFCQAFQTSQGHIIDWCCGKGYLGRTLAQAYDVSAIGLELNAELCAAGELYCRRQGVAMRFYQTDVLERDACPALPDSSHAIALHACGDLHRRLAHWCVERKIPQLTLVPCCYALWLGKQQYVPMSQAGRANNLYLQRDHLKLAVQEVVTASARQAQQLQQINAWRLGFDELQRDLRGVDSYLLTPSVPKSAVNWGFESVVRHLAAGAGFSLPRTIDWPEYENRGQQRWQRTRRLQLVAQGFRRLLELWLVYDLLLFLQQSGFTPSLARFCQRSVTPRNLMISAVAG